MGDYAHALRKAPICPQREKQAVAEKLHEYTGLLGRLI